MVCRIVYGDQDQATTVQNLASALSFKVSPAHLPHTTMRLATALNICKVTKYCTFTMANVQFLAGGALQDATPYH